MKPQLPMLAIKKTVVYAAGVLLPVAMLLTACGGQVNIPNNNTIVAPNLTATPAELIVWPNDRPSVPDGKAVFQQNCASCHSGNGGGSGGNANFNAEWAHSTMLSDIYRTIAFGGSDPDPRKRTHPAFADKLNVTQLWNAAVYVRSLGQPTLTDKEIAAIDPVFGSNCAVCHGTKGDGDPGNLGISHSLEPQPANFKKFDRFFNRTDDVLYDHIANGIRWEPMPNFLGKKDAKKGITFDEPYIRKLVQYVRNFQINNAPVLAANTTGSAGAVGGSEAGSTTPEPGATKGGAGPNPTEGGSTLRPQGRMTH